MSSNTKKDMVITQIKDHIASLTKPYVRSIIRGKKTKPVELGAKVNKVLIDGLDGILQLRWLSSRQPFGARHSPAAKAFWQMH